MRSRKAVKKRARAMRKASRGKMRAKDYFQIALVILIIAGIIGFALYMVDHL